MDRFLTFALRRDGTKEEEWGGHNSESEREIKSYLGNLQTFSWNCSQKAPMNSRYVPTKETRITKIVSAKTSFFCCELCLPICKVEHLFCYLHTSRVGLAQLLHLALIHFWSDVFRPSFIIIILFVGLNVKKGSGTVSSKQFCIRNTFQFRFFIFRFSS